MQSFVLFLLFVCLGIPVEGFSKTLRAPEEFYSQKDWEQFRFHKGYPPYLCEFGYRALADHVIDANHMEFDPAKVKLGDSVYVAVWYLDWFVKHVHDHIPNPYLLITCDVGSWLPHVEHLKLAYDPKVVYWFAKNMLFTNHNKLHQLPMGQFYYLWAHGTDYYFPTLTELVATSPHDKDILLYLNHTERNHGRRILVADKFWDKPYCFNRNRPREPLTFDKFWEEIARSKFVLSPLGLEVDCTRTWECFILGAIPIVEHSYLDPLYQDLPILLVHEWDEIDEAFLHQKYTEIHQQPQKLERAHIDYWADTLREKQKTIREGHLEDSDLEANNFSESDIESIKQILNRHKKTKHNIVYVGNMTCLRPFQLAHSIPSIPTLLLNDLWTQHGLPLLSKFSKNPSLLTTNRVQIINAHVTTQLSSLSDKSIFIDLTHFRHKLFKSTSELGDFSHSLEKDLLSLFKQLAKDELLFGNMTKDPYVKEVLDRLKAHHKIPIQITGNFWTISDC